MPNTPFTLNFDDLVPASGNEGRIPDGYGGFSWGHAAYHQVDGAIPGYTPTSGQTIAFIAEAHDFEVPGYEDAPRGAPLVMSRAEAFDLLSGDFSAAYRSGLVITAQAYADEAGTQLLGSMTFTADQWVARTVTFDLAVFSGVRRIEFNANDGNDGTSDYFGFDNLTLRDATVAGVPCFVAGTAILTPRGAVPVESLRAGDLVCTADNWPQPLLWIGGREVVAPAPHHCPVVFPAMAGRAALALSPQHCVVQTSGDQEFFVRARHLAEGGPTRARIARGRRSLRYLHLLFERHQVVIAEGVLTESFWPGPQALSALAPRAADEVRRLVPGLRGGPVESAYGPRARPLLDRRALREGEPPAAPVCVARARAIFL